MLLQRVTNQIQASSQAAACRLRVLFGDQSGSEIALPPVGVVVGADAACDVVLSDQAVSGRHATVVPGARGFDVTDLGSRNGTWLDGVSITRATVPVGTTIRIGT